MKPTDPLPVKLICGILYSDEGRVGQADQQLIEKYGPVDYRSPVYPFDITDYYEAEMGKPIYRVFTSYTHLISPNRLAAIKIECNSIEDQLALAGRRRVNIDAGYMDYDKFVLASAKYNAHKIYLDYGIYADLTLQFTRGRFVPSKWCFPDFKSGLYNETFLHIRAKYKGQVRKWRKN
jgi:hypothetical protein